jgi:DNA-binding NarL/FixJ family response regulator
VSQQPQTLIEPLTERELAVMELYSIPKMEKAEICQRLAISYNTLNSHITSAFQKLGEADRFAAAWRFWELYPESYDKVKKAVREAA